MDGYHVVGVTLIPYPGYGCIIIIVSKEEKTYLVSIANSPQCTCPDFVKLLSLAMGRERSIGFMQALVSRVHEFVQG